MNTQPANQQDSQATIDMKIRTLRTLWFGIFMSLVLYYGLTLFAGRPDNGPNDMLSLILVVIGFSITLISFPLKNKLLRQAVDQQQVQLVQQGYIVALALTEVPALLGLLDFFVTSHRHYYVLFLIAALGQLLHFPRREHVVNASFKSPIV